MSIQKRNEGHQVFVVKIKFNRQLLQCVLEMEVEI